MRIPALALLFACVAVPAASAQPAGDLGAVAFAPPCHWWWRRRATVDRAPVSRRRAKPPWWVPVTAAALLASAVAAPTALAVPNIYLVEPEFSLGWGWVPYGPEPTATQRIRIRNEGTTARIVEVSVFYDARCALQGSEAEDVFRLRWCEGFCEENDGDVTVWLYCSAILATSYLASPSALYEDESGELSVLFTNQRPEPITVDGTAAEAPFAAALEGGPVTVAQGQGGSVQVSYQASTPGRIVGVIDILAGDDVVGRTNVELVTLPQIAPASVSMFSVPLGATYAQPVTIRNSSDLTRTITAVSSDVAGVELPGVVGRTMAPGEVIDALATVQANALGELGARLSVEFDVAQGDSMLLSATVVPAELAVEVDDATPSDGLLELGVVSIAAGTSDRTVTLRNRGAEELVIAADDPGDDDDGSGDGDHPSDDGDGGDDDGSDDGDGDGADDGHGADDDDGADDGDGSHDDDDDGSHDDDGSDDGDQPSGCGVQRGDGGGRDLLAVAGIALLAAGTRRRRTRSGRG